MADVSTKAPALNFVCGSTINPMTFVKVSTTADYQCLPCSSATDAIIGIAQVGSRKPPVDSATQEAGNSGDPIGVWGAGQTCYLTLGTTVTRGQLLTCDTNANGIPATGTASYGAVAEESGVGGNDIRVTVVLGVL